MTQPARAWSFLTLLDRQHEGNLGYDDDPSGYYSFDSTVPNSGHVERGHLAVLRDSDQVLGTGIISEVTAALGEKLRRRCPKCTSTGFKARAKLVPTYRCAKCKKEFDDPADEMIEVTFYRAVYGDTWKPARHVTVKQLESAYYGHAQQHAIRELKIDVALRLR